MSLDPRALHIYTDGSCLKNPGGRGGAAAIVEYPESVGKDLEQIVDVSYAETTNNRMELRACIEALDWIRTKRHWPGVTRVQLITDSKYVRENLSRAGDWLANEGQNLSGEPMQNLDLWKELLGARSITGIRTDFEWSLGKSSPLTKMVDKAAKAAAKRGGLYEDRGYQPGKVSRSKVKGAALRFNADGGYSIIYVYRKNAAGKRNRIRFHLFEEAAQIHSGSYYAYASDELTLDLHRGHLYRVLFNGDPQVPTIEQIIEEVRPNPNCPSAE